MQLINKQKKMIYAEEAYNIIGAAMEVHRVLGPGFLEAVYHEALEVEMRKRDIPFETKVALPIQYKDVVLKKVLTKPESCDNISEH